MAAMKLARSSLSSLNLSLKASRQSQKLLSNSLRPMSSVVSKYCIHKGRQNNVKLCTTVCAQREMSSNTKFEVLNVQDEEDFKNRVICASESNPIVVDFHATWCGPCKMLAPRLESIISKKEGKVILAKVDIDDNPDLAMEYGVRSVPTVIGIKSGKQLGQFIGVLDDDQIDSFVEKLIIS